MPLFKQLKLKQTDIYFWKITETESFFRKNIRLSPKCLQQLNLRKKKKKPTGFFEYKKNIVKYWILSQSIKL